MLAFDILYSAFIIRYSSFDIIINNE